MSLPLWARAVNPVSHWFVTFAHECGEERHLVFPRDLDAREVLECCRGLLGEGWRFVERDNPDYADHLVDHPSPLFNGERHSLEGPCTTRSVSSAAPPAAAHGARSTRSGTDRPARAVSAVPVS